MVYRRSPLVAGTTCPLLVRMRSLPAPGSARTRTTMSRSRSLAVSASALSGVTSNALATAQMASRRVKVDPSRVTGIARVSGASSLVDLPVIERHPGLAGKDPEDRLGVFGSGWDGRFVAEGGGEVIDTGRPRGTFAVGELDLGELLDQPARSTSAGPSRRVCAAGWRGPPSAASADVTHVAHRRFDVYPSLGERPEDRFGMSRSSPRPLRRTCQARPSGSSSARRRSDTASRRSFSR